MDFSMAAFRPRHTPQLSLAQLVAGLCPQPKPSWKSVQVRGISMDSTDLVEGEVFLALGGARFHAAQFAPAVIAQGASAIITDQAGADLVRELTSPQTNVPSGLGENSSSSQSETGPTAATATAPIPVVVIENPRQAVSTLAIRAYDNPAEKLLTIGVTGTNGKTTSCTAAWQALEAAGKPCALFGTAQMRVGELTQTTPRTTLEAPVIHRCLALAVEQGCQAAVIEVSAHALSLHRIDGIVFDGVLFTNLQHDHLDFYQSMENYFAAKAELFTAAHAKRAVICVDDPWGEKLAGQCALSQLTYRTVAVDSNAAADLSHLQADWQVSGIEPDPARIGTKFQLQALPPDHTFGAESAVTSDKATSLAKNASLSQPDSSAAARTAALDNAAEPNLSSSPQTTTGRPAQTYQLHLGIPGDYNVQNAAGVFLLLTQLLGLPSEVVAHSLSQISVPGRFQIITPPAQRVSLSEDEGEAHLEQSAFSGPASAGSLSAGSASPSSPSSVITPLPLVICDYAHTPEGLLGLLKIARLYTRGKIHLVFGTDGDRDASKREDLAMVAAQLADYLWVTDENPRTEDPAAIRAQLLKGIARIRPELEHVREVTTCRRDAVREAILSARPQDLVLMTGKGSECYQEINRVYHRYLDADVAEDVLAAWPHAHY